MSQGPSILSLMREMTLRGLCWSELSKWAGKSGQASKMGLHMDLASSWWQWGGCGGGKKLWENVAGKCNGGKNVAGK